MAKSSTSSRSSNTVAAAKPKPDRPYPGFPLFPHATMRWAKKIGGRLHYFGPWHDPIGALEKFNRQWPYLSTGRTPPRDLASGPCSLGELCRAFLSAKEALVESRELSPYTYGEYVRTTETLCEHFGEKAAVAGLRPVDFERFRRHLAMNCNVVTLKSKINRCRVVFKFAKDRGLISRPVEYGESFNRPAAKSLRKVRNLTGGRMFEQSEIQSLLRHADDVMRAMILLGINCGFGNTDLSELPRSAFRNDFTWVEFPRPKTEVMRRIPLWKETSQAVKSALKHRPPAQCAEDDGLCFLTVRGNRYVRIQASQRSPNKFVTVSTIASQFQRLMSICEVTDVKGRGFYGLRHSFETIAGESRDQVAVDAIMGHADQSMAAAYRERISDQRLKEVVEYVRRWLFTKSTQRIRSRPRNAG